MATGEKMEVEMSDDPLFRLEAAIVLAARERDKKHDDSRDAQVAKDRRRDQVRDVWAERKKELPAMVAAINRMLTEHRYEALTVGVFELKHSDLDRMVIDFAHSLHSHTKILFSVTTAGEFTCAVGAFPSETGKTTMPIEELTENRLKVVLANAVEECLSGKRDPRP